MNNEKLDRLKQVSGQDSYLYQLAQENSSQSLETSENDIIGQDKGGYYTDKEYVSNEVAREQGFGDPEYLQERADEFRKDDSEPIWNE